MKNIVVAIALLLLSGCGTISNCFPSNPEVFLAPYGGVTVDREQLNESVTKIKEKKETVFDYLLVAGSACDMPFCAVTDTVMLPVTIPYSFMDSLAHMDDDRRLYPRRRLRSKRAEDEEWEKFWFTDDPNTLRTRIHGGVGP